MSCSSQMYSKVNHLYTHMYLFFFRFFSHVGYWRALSRVLCTVQWALIGHQERLESGVCSILRKLLITQSCPTLCDPVDCSPPGSSVCGILQARTLEWVALQAGSLLSEPPGKGSILKKCPITWETSSSRGAAPSLRSCEQTPLQGFSCLPGRAAPFWALRVLSPSCPLHSEWPPPLHPSAGTTVIRVTLRFTLLTWVWESCIHFFPKLTTGTSTAPKLFSGCLWLSSSVYNFSLILEVFRNVDYILYAELDKGWINWFIKTALFYSYNESEGEVVQSCPTLWDIMDCSLTGSAIHGTFQARVLVWVVISFSRGSSQPRSSMLRADALPSESPGKPQL